MQERRIASKVANVLVADAEARLEALGAGPAGAADRFKERHGGLWVGGRVTPTRSEIAFAPNRWNRAVHTTDTATSLAIADVVDVSVSKAAFTSIVTVTARSGASLTFRCCGAKKFANQIRAAATQAER